MPRPRRGGGIPDGPRLLMRTSGWEAKKQKFQTSKQAAQYLISSSPAPQPPSSPSSPPAAPATGPGAMAARQSPSLAAALLPHLAEQRSYLAAGDAERDNAEQSLAPGSNPEPHRWPATIALLPDGRISGVCCPEQYRSQ